MISDKLLDCAVSVSPICLVQALTHLVARRWATTRSFHCLLSCLWNKYRLWYYNTHHPCNPLRWLSAVLRAVIVMIYCHHSKVLMDSCLFLAPELSPEIKMRTCSLATLPVCPALSSMVTVFITVTNTTGRLINWPLRHCSCSVQRK